MESTGSIGHEQISDGKVPVLVVRHLETHIYDEGSITGGGGFPSARKAHHWESPR